jgi:transketolase
VIRDVDGNDITAIDNAIKVAKNDPRPSLIVCKTHIGYGLPTRQDTAKAHGEPPGEEELAGAKEKLGWPIEPRFYVPDDVLLHFREAIGRGDQAEGKWLSRLSSYRRAYSELAEEFERRMEKVLPEGWDMDLPEFPADDEGMATRVASGKVLNTLANRISELVGGSADLAPSNKTWIDGSPSFQYNSRDGRNFNFGVREHAMGAIINGMVVHGGVIPYGGTFFVFSDYMRPAVRISALSNYPSIWVFTHDSIGLGEDGPTHQPVEHLAALRAIPNLIVIRPADANEVTEAWKVAISRRNGPTALIFSRQNVPTLDRKMFSPASELNKGAYVLANFGDGKPQLLLMASGTEIYLVIDAAKRLAAKGITVRVISFPSWELFESQDEVYQNSVLLPDVHARLAVEAGVSMGWERWVGDKGAIIGVERFGASAPYKKLYQEFGLSVDNIISCAKSLLQ